METLGNRIRLLRKILKLSQKEFGSRIGVSYGHISNIERDKDIPSEMIIKLIVINYHTTKEWLMYGDGPMIVRTHLLTSESEKIESEAAHMNENTETLLQDEKTEFEINEERLLEMMGSYYEENINIYGDQTDDIIEKVTNYIESLSIGSDEKMELCDSLGSIEASAGHNAFNIGFKEGIRLFRTLMKL